MAYTQAQIDTLRDHIARGVRRMRLNGEEIEFRSVAEMERTLAAMEAEVSGGARSELTVKYATTSRGL